MSTAILGNQNKGLAVVDLGRLVPNVDGSPLNITCGIEPDAFLKKLAAAPVEAAPVGVASVEAAAAQVAQPKAAVPFVSGTVDFGSKPVKQAAGLSFVRKLHGTVDKLHGAIDTFMQQKGEEKVIAVGRCAKIANFIARHEELITNGLLGVAGFAAFHVPVALGLGSLAANATIGAGCLAAGPLAKFIYNYGFSRESIGRLKQEWNRKADAPVFEKAIHRTILCVAAANAAALDACYLGSKLLVRGAEKMLRYF